MVDGNVRTTGFTSTVLEAEQSQCVVIDVFCRQVQRARAYLYVSIHTAQALQSFSFFVIRFID